jgi:hypothetical protein
MKIAIGMTTGFVVYFGSSYLLKIDELKEVQLLVRNLIKRNG